MVHKRTNQLAQGEVHLWKASLSDWISVSSRFLAWLSPHEIQRLERYKIQNKKEGFLISHGLLRGILSSYLDQPPGEVDLISNQAGKPRIRGSEIKFNLSHSGGRWILGISSSFDCGLDIETINPIVKLDYSIQKTLHPVEVDYLDGFNTREEFLQEYISIWTAKEAYLKGSGWGIRGYPNWFSLLPDPDRKGMFILDNPRNPQDNKIWTIRSLKTDGDYLGSIALNGGNPVIKTNNINPSDYLI